MYETDELVKEYFRLKNLEVREIVRPDVQNDRAKILKETSRPKEKFWETGLLWKNDELPIADSQTTALKRLFFLE